MVKKKLVYGLAALLLTGCSLTGLMGCGNKATAEGRTEIEIVSYKKEAVDTFNKIAARFNETHDDIHLTIDSPNEAMTILKIRFIREDYPDIIVIGGDMDYSNFLPVAIVHMKLMPQRQEFRLHKILWFSLLVIHVIGICP